MPPHLPVLQGSRQGHATEWLCSSASSWMPYAALCRVASTHTRHTHRCHATRQGKSGPLGCCCCLMGLIGKFGCWLHLIIAGLSFSPGRRSCRLCALLRKAALAGYSSKYSVVVSAAHTGAWVLCKVVHRLVEVVLKTCRSQEVFLYQPADVPWFARIAPCSTRLSTRSTRQHEFRSSKLFILSRKHVSVPELCLRQDLSLAGHKRTKSMNEATWDASAHLHGCPL